MSVKLFGSENHHLRQRLARALSDVVAFLTSSLTTTHRSRSAISFAVARLRDSFRKSSSVISTSCFTMPQTGTLHSLSPDALITAFPRFLGCDIGSVCQIHTSKIALWYAQLHCQNYRNSDRLHPRRFPIPCASLRRPRAQSLRGRAASYLVPRLYL